jgi:hypothetical protein
MNIERELAQLSAWIDFPAAPEVMPGLSQRAARRSRRRRAALALALAVIAAVVAVLAASPGARSGILRWIGIEGVELQRVPKLPATSPIAEREASGRLATLDAAAAGTRFPFRLPRLEGLSAPDRVYLDGNVPDGLVTFVWGQRGRQRLLLSEWRGNTKVHFHKLIQPGVETRKVRVDGDPGIWVAGPPHAVFFRDADGFFSHARVRLAANVLLWMRGDISYRLEADVPLKDSLAIAESLPANG